MGDMFSLLGNKTDNVCIIFIFPLFNSFEFPLSILRSLCNFLKVTDNEQVTLQTSTESRLAPGTCMLKAQKIPPTSHGFNIRGEQKLSLSAKKRH